MHGFLASPITASTHNSARIVDGNPLTIEAEAVPHGNVISVPLDHLAARAGLSADVWLEVQGSAISLSIASSDTRDILCPEQIIAPASSTLAMVEVASTPDDGACLLIRSAPDAEGDVRIRLAAIRIGAPRKSAAHYATRLPVRNGWEVYPRKAATEPADDRIGFACRIAVTHTTREWEWSTCTRDYFKARYSRPGRLNDLPPLAELEPAPRTFYTGGVSILEVSVSGHGATLVPIAVFDTALKIQAVQRIGDHCYLCGEDEIAVFDADALLGGRADDLDPLHVHRDPWFGGLHTLFPAPDGQLVISASGPDAVLWMDPESGDVTRRWRLPESRYGRNYDLSPGDSVRDHYIHNDIQLGHLNCAFPLRDGRVAISTLGQGDIGLVDPDDRYQLVTTGHIGCHGIRQSAFSDDLYFVNSCSGLLHRIAPDAQGSYGETNCEVVANADSRWLHDACEVAPALYLLSIGDRNELVLFDVEAGAFLARWSFEGHWSNVQFLNVV